MKIKVRKVNMVALAEKFGYECLLCLFTVNMLIRAKTFNENQGSEGEHSGFSSEVRLQVLAMLARSKHIDVS